MANKYANLVGTNLIKDEYTKINTGFDGVEADIKAVNTRVDTIITTDGAAVAQEIVNARVSAVKEKTFATLDARFEETEQDIATHMAEKVSLNGAHGLKIESGKWTPEYAPASGNSFASITYRLQIGNYTKIGKLVYINLFLSTQSFEIGTASGDLTIKGLPFPSNIFEGFTPEGFNINDIYRFNFGTAPANIRVHLGLGNLLLPSNDAKSPSVTRVSVANLNVGDYKNELRISGWYTTL